MYNLTEYSDNYSDISGSLWQFKREEIEENNNLIVDNSLSFKYKSNIIGNLSQAGTRNNVKIVVPLKYLSNFWRSLEMPLINCKVELSLKWYERCLLTVANTATFKITDAKLYVPIVTLSAEDNVKLSKLLGEGFKRPIYWNQYKVIPNKTYAANRYIRELLDSSYQGIKRLFVLAYDNSNGITPNSHKRYFLARIKIKNYNIKIDGRNLRSTN